VTGFDGLFAAQDIASGFQLGAFAAKGLPAFGAADEFLSSSAYLGAGNSRALAAIATEVEGRMDATNHWDDVIGSSRAAFYIKGSAASTLMVSDELTFGSRSHLPLQLSFSDWRGGMLGYHSSSEAGTQRNVVRAEFRQAREAAMHNADAGVALFGSLGWLRAGDAPYGVSARRASIGVSLLGAYPTGSKRTARLDLAWPLSRATDTAHGMELRLAIQNPIGRFWNEPDDINRARTGGLPSALFGW
jgi:hypothetical protein